VIRQTISNNMLSGYIPSQCCTLASYDYGFNFWTCPIPPMCHNVNCSTQPPKK